MGKFSYKDQDWWKAANGKPPSGKDYRSVLHGFDWDRQNETRAKRAKHPTDDEIAAELKLRAERDQEGIARRKPVLDRMFPSRLKN